MPRTTVTIEFEDLSPEVLGIILGIPGAKVEPTPAETEKTVEATPEPKKRATRKKAEAPSEPEPVKPEPVKAEPVKAEPVKDPEPDDSDDPVSPEMAEDIVKTATSIIRAGRAAEIRAALDAVGSEKVSTLASIGQARKFLELIAPLAP